MIQFLAVGVTLVLFAMKMMGNFDGSWWVVFSPMIICYVIIFIILLITSLIAMKKYK